MTLTGEPHRSRQAKPCSAHCGQPEGIPFQRRVVTVPALTSSVNSFRGLVFGHFQQVVAALAPSKQQVAAVQQVIGGHGGILAGDPLIVHVHRPL